MNEKQRLIVVRDQFALKNLSDDALKLILPAYTEALKRIEFLLRTMPEGKIERELWLKTQLRTIEAQFQPVAERIYQVLPEAQVRAFEEGLSNAEEFLEAGDFLPEGVAPSAAPTVNVTNALEQGFISPSITRQQVIAASRETGFSVLGPGGAKKGLAELLPGWMQAEAGLVEKRLRTGFLLGQTNEEIMREIGPLARGRKGWAMTEAVVRSSMAEASQVAHEAFYEANQTFSIVDDDGVLFEYNVIAGWEWDASNDTRLCTICAPLDGLTTKKRDEMPPWLAHYGCRCKILPITQSEAAARAAGDLPKGSFLEATPVEKDSNGKRKPPPAGYTGDNAYKRPMKIHGKWQWVRRRDLGVGQTTAGDMLKNANDHSKRLILGNKKLVKEWNKRIQQKRYANDPQQLVRDLLSGR